LIVYTDKFRSYDALMCCGYRHLKIDHRKNFPTVRSISMALRASGAMPKND
jgi:hypothetical protein